QREVRPARPRRGLRHADRESGHRASHGVAGGPGTCGLGPRVVARRVGSGSYGDLLAMRRAGGQALLETAIVVPVMVVLMLGFLAILIRIEEIGRASCRG